MKHRVLALAWALAGAVAWAAENAAADKRGTAPTTFPSEGIASHYVGDVGIERDPRVVFVEDFEQSLDETWKRWETVGDRPGMSLSEDVPRGSAGKHSLIMERQTGPGAQLYRRLKNKGGGWG
ncbi:MAG TPA: hypothetical protein VK846_05670, partial [Candidatus Limnocylindria bacterium]|nr:hypothetical protein [Candidatus Limnocylindria bacterium]